MRKYDCEKYGECLRAAAMADDQRLKCRVCKSYRKVARYSDAFGAVAGCDDLAAMCGGLVTGIRNGGGFVEPARPVWRR